MRIPLIVAALLAVLPAAAPADPPDPAPATTPAAPAAPRFRLPARGGFAALDSLAGDVVVVDFWASWCAPCHKSFPWLGSLAARYGSKGLRVVAINLDKSRAAADAFLMKNPAPFTIAFDPDGKTAEAYHVAAMPSTYLVGADGTLLYTHRGFDPKEADLFEQRIQAALGVASGAAR